MFQYRQHHVTCHLCLTQRVQDVYDKIDKFTWEFVVNTTKHNTKRDKYLSEQTCPLCNKLSQWECLD